MKKKIIPVTLTFTFLALSMVSVFSLKDKKEVEVEAYSISTLPTTIDLNDSTESEIRNYYSSLNSLSESEKKGNNLLKNLKTILKNGQKYYAYDTSGERIWQMYEITDRDWDKSPASSTTYGTYNANTNKITGYTYGTSTSNKKNNPYIHALYVNRDVDNQTRAWDDHQQTQWGINREHIWPKSQGFNASGAGGARGDPMHLWAGNGRVNGTEHNNYLYAFVDTSKSYTDPASERGWTNLSNNLRGVSLTVGGSDKVFEPQDCDKGDIARAVFYMVARYNYISGSDSDGIDQNNPNLGLSQTTTALDSFTSSEEEVGEMGILTDLLAWNRLDPPDEYEIHRNNLLYKNYTNNRNPFIDFPEWAEYIWGSAVYNGRNYQSYSSTPTGYAAPATNTLNNFSDNTDSVAISKSSVSLTVGNTTTINAVSSDNSNITWTTSNASIASISSSSSSSGTNITITANAVGSATITAKATINGVLYSERCTVTVDTQSISVSSVSLNESSMTLVKGGHSTLTATVLPANATNKNITWTSSNTSIATVSDGVVTAKAVGNTTITVRTEDGNKTATCTVTVINSGSGEETTSTVSIASYASSHSWSNDTKYTSISIDENVTATVSNGGSNTGKYYTNGNNWRFYQGESARMTISVASGYTIDSVTLTFTVENTGILKYGNTTISSGSSVDINDTSATFSVNNSGSATNGQVRFTNISVTYHSNAVPVAPTSITASVDKTFEVGDTITKSDISVVDNLGRDVDDFEFSDYQFTYEDAASGGSLTNKNLTVTYNEYSLSDTFTVQVSRREYEIPDTSFVEFTGAEFISAGITTSTAYKDRSTGNFTVDGVGFYIYQAYVYTGRTPNTLSFSKGKTVIPGYMFNTTPFATGITSVTVNDESVSPNIRVKVNESDAWQVVDEGFDFYTANYHYFKLDYDFEDGTTINSYTNISSVVVELKGSETALTTSDYLMFEDTTNQCVTKLNDATMIFENMTLSERNTFMTSDDYVISSARERLNAWATNQGKVITHINGDYVLESVSSSHKEIMTPKGNSPAIIVIVVTITLLGSISAFYLYRKRKEQ